MDTEIKPKQHRSVEEIETELNEVVDDIQQKQWEVDDLESELYDLRERESELENELSEAEEAAEESEGSEP